MPDRTSDVWPEKVTTGVLDVRSQSAAVVSSEQVRRWARLSGENLVTWTGLGSGSKGSVPCAQVCVAT